MHFYPKAFWRIVIKIGEHFQMFWNISFCKIGLKYPIVLDKKVRISEGIQKLDFPTKSSEKIQCIVEGIASWLAQLNFSFFVIYILKVESITGLRV